MLEVGLQGGRWGSQPQPSPLAAVALHLLSHAGWLSVAIPRRLGHLGRGLCTSLCPCCQPTANSPLAGDRNQPCLVLVQDWETLEALGDLLPALRDVVEGTCSLLPAGLSPALPKRCALERISPSTS